MIVKTCLIHGNLTKDQVIKNGLSKKTGLINWRCRQCARMRLKEYNERNPHAQKLASRKYRRQFYDSRLRWATVKRKFGLEKEQFEEISKTQNNLCAICKNPEKIMYRITRKRTEFLCVDHCHSTMKIRGLLCRSCNAGLGNFKDSLELLEAAITYLNSFIP